jgi:hypothetical protein
MNAGAGEEGEMDLRWVLWTSAESPARRMPSGEEEEEEVVVVVEWWCGDGLYA